jgi:hypothetical protein
MCLLFNVVSGSNLAQGSVDQNHGGVAQDEDIRKYDGLCTKSKQKGTGENVYARFLPNKYDYYTKPQPSAPVTKGEHIRHLLIRSQPEVSGFIKAVEKSGTKDEHLVRQKEEMSRALEDFRLFKSGKDKSGGNERALPACERPFPAPKI